MALRALFFAVGALIESRVAAHAQLVIGVHTAQHQLLRRFLMANGTVGIVGVKADAPRCRNLVPCVHLVMTGDTAPGTSGKEVVMTCHAAGMNSIGHIGWHSLICLPARRHALLMAVSTILRFRLNVSIFMVTETAVHANFLMMPVMPPFFALQFIMVAGGTRSIVSSGRDVIFLEGSIKYNAVAAFAGAHVFTGFSAFMMTGLTGYLQLVRVLSVLKNHSSACILHKNAPGYFFLMLGEHIPCKSKKSQDACNEGDGQVTLLQ